MLRDFDEIMDLPVHTQSGEHLGKTNGVVIEIETQTIYQYKIKPSGISHLFSKELLIHRDQVVSIQKDKIIVQDGLYSEYNKKHAVAQKKQSLQTETAISNIKRM
jgi:sporulation protein YlmC with PRC-barrel domain